MQNKVRIGEAVRHWRRRANLSQAELAAHMGYPSRPTIVGIEQNKRWLSQEEVDTMEALFAARTGEDVNLLQFIQPAPPAPRDSEMTVAMIEGVRALAHVLTTCDQTSVEVQTALAQLGRDRGFRRLRRAAVRAALNM